MLNLMRQKSKEGTMEVYTLNATHDTPQVYFDHLKGLIKISGRSMPDDARGFFAPLKTWVRKYVEHPKSVTEIIIDLEYFNSASSTMIYELLRELGKLIQNGLEIKAKWYYLDGDYDMEEAGKIFAEITNVPFEFEKYE